MPKDFSCKFIRNLITKRLLKAGYSFYAANKLSEKWLKDFLGQHQTGLKQKLWAYQRGFLSHLVPFYGLTEENVRDYISYFVYYKLHPINGLFSHWIDDKLTSKRILSPFSAYFPEYYFHLYQGEILCLSERPVEYSPNIESIIELLKDKKTLAGKPISGSSGAGFVKLGYDHGTYAINNENVSVFSIRYLLLKWLENQDTGMILTEYLKSHSKLCQIWQKTPNTIRISILRNKNEPAKIVNAYIRFGSEKTGLIDNVGAGGSCIIELESGVFKDGKVFFTNRVSGLLVPH